MWYAQTELEQMIRLMFTLFYAEASTESAEDIAHLVLSVLHDLVVCLLVFFSRLLELNCIDLDSEKLCREAIIELKCVIIPDFPALQTSHV